MRLPTHKNVLCKVGEIAGTTWHSDDAVLIKKKLRITWTKLDQQVTLEKIKQEDFLTELATEASKNSD